MGRHTFVIARGHPLGERLNETTYLRTYSARICLVRSSALVMNIRKILGCPVFAHICAALLHRLHLGGPTTTSHPTAGYGARHARYLQRLTDGSCLNNQIEAPGKRK